MCIYFIRTNKDFVEVSLQMLGNLFILMLSKQFIVISEIILKTFFVALMVQKVQG